MPSLLGFLDHVAHRLAFDERLGNYPGRRFGAEGSAAKGKSYHPAGDAFSFISSLMFLRFGRLLSEQNVAAATTPNISFEKSVTAYGSTCTKLGDISGRTTKKLTAQMSVRVQREAVNTFPAGACLARANWRI